MVLDGPGDVMARFLPPLCLLLALAMLIAGFALVAVEPPSDPLQLHAARVSGDDAVRDVLEAQVARRQLARRVLVGSLFAGSVLMTILAFLTMAPSK